jgi:xanthomonalisin
VGIAAADQPLHIAVALKLRDRDQLNAFIAARRQLAATGAQLGVAMTTQEFLDRHAPTADRAQAVADYLTQEGFTNVQVEPNRLLVTADGNVDSAQRAFHTTFVNVTRNGRNAYANDKDVVIPASLQNDILSVVGLQDVHQMHTMNVVANAAPALRTQSVTGHNPTTFSAIYGGSGVPTASTVTVGIIAEGKLTQTVTDLKTFTTNNGLTAVTTQIVGPGSSDTSGIEEWNLDSQDIVGMAGGKVAKLIFYDASSLSNSALTSIINTAVSANVAKVINVSLGECETDTSQDGSMAADDQLFQTAEAQGQTFSISSGDSGADECGDGGVTPSYPASSPHVIAVGGTTLNTSGSTYTSETAWSGSGGSPSLVEPRPSWQTAVTGSFRVVPDVAFDADPNSGALVIVRGSSEQIGGTSLAAPLFTASWARLLAAHSSLGFAGPHIYKLPASDYHDVTSGNNGGYSASSGYDFVTGRGSFNLGTVNGNIASF